MKYLILFCFAIASISIINAQDTKVKVSDNKVKTKTKMTAGHTNASTMMPYKATYSSNFQIGNSKYSKIVLDAWKAYDDNTFDKLSSDIISDTVRAIMSDGTVLQGKDKFMNAIKEFRGGFSSAKSDIAAWIPVKSDKQDDLVLIWGTETDTKNDGTSSKSEVHEIWGFNKAGKVSFFKQYMAQPTKDSN